MATPVTGGQAVLHTPAGKARLTHGPAAASKENAHSLLKALSLPSLFRNGVPSGAEAAKGTAERDFLIHAGAEAEGGAAVPAASPVFSPQQGLVPASAEQGRPTPAVASPSRPISRTAYFPLAFAGISAALLGLTAGLSALMTGVVPLSLPLGASLTVHVVQMLLQQAASIFGASTAVSVAYAVSELILFSLGVAVRKDVPEQDFHAFLREELRHWDLHPSVREALLGVGPGKGLLKSFRPPSRFSSLTYGFTAGGAIYLRPELIRTPWLFRQVLRHELDHLRDHFARGPPKQRSMMGRAASSFISEWGTRVREWGGRSSLKSMRIPVLDRVLQEARISLRVGSPYEVLIVDPDSEELRSPAAYERLSDGLAQVRMLDTAGSPTGLGLSEYLQQADAGRFRYVVFSKAFKSLPAPATIEAARLHKALGQLEEIYILAQRLARLKAARIEGDGTDLLRLRVLMEDVSARPVKAVKLQDLDRIVDDMYYQVSRNILSKTGLGKTLESLYERMHFRGVTLLPFEQGDPGLDVVERVLRTWQASDTGGFAVQRVDMPEGGHVLVARRIEPRVDLWLTPKEGVKFADSLTNIASGAPLTSEQEAVLRRAGFVDEDLAVFRSAGLVVRHVFGADVGENRIFVTVRKAQAKALKRYARTAGIRFSSSYKGYQLHLLNSGPIQRVDGAWSLDLKGDGGRIYDIDTGLDASHPDFSDRAMQSVDFVDEGPEDWIGHGSHKAGISYANGTLYKGMAPHALGRMGKVFAQNGMGASDGDIMAAAVDAMKWGADVISLSLGSPGAVEAPLALFFSKLTQQTNANGQHPIVTGSAGNSGPFSETRSQPSVGEFVTSVMAAAKSLDDGIPEVSFYSSVGPVMDQRFSRKRYRRPMGLTALGGDVTTPPGVQDVYGHGIESVKSKDMTPSPSDTLDGKHTRMSGTSMSNPMIAAVALLVKQAAMRVLTAGTPAYQFFMDQLPFAVNMLLMRSSRDMGVPIVFQESGFVDAKGAVELAAQSFGGSVQSLTHRAAMKLASFVTGHAAAPAAPASYEWIQRARRVWELEDRPYVEGDAAREKELASLKESLGRLVPSVPREDGMDDEQLTVIIKQALGNAGGKAFDQRFNEVRTEVLPQLLSALKDPVWLVRMYAAFALLNLKAPEAVTALMDLALRDPDGRVRQVAFLALGETPTYAVDEALRQAVNDDRPDVGSYAAYVLARHGDPRGVRRIVTEVGSEDKRVRMTAVWLLGQLGKRAPPQASDTLAARVSDPEERGNITHVAVASLASIAVAEPDSVTANAISKLLAVSGPQNFALTRTVLKFFQAAVRAPSVREKMREEPLRTEIVDFIHKNKQAASRPGALGQMVQLLAKVLDVPLEVPSPLPDLGGLGVPGVDPNLGPVHLIVELPAGSARTVQRFQDFRGRNAQAEPVLAELGLDGGLLERHGAVLQAAMPVSQTLWVSVPDAEVTALTTELESRGVQVRRAKPMYRLLHETSLASGMPEIRASHGGLDGKNVLVAYLDEGGDTGQPAISKDRIKAVRNFTDDGAPSEVEKEGVSHGTHGMGIVGARSVDGSPYEGMAPGASFAIGKVLGANGGSEATVLAGLEWAATLVEDPLKTPLLINMSLGGPGAPDSVIGRLVTRLRLKDIGVIAAVGNAGPMEGTVSSPANAPLAIAVGAVGKDGKLTDYSSRGRPGKEKPSWLDFGGAVFLDRTNLYEIVSTLSTRLKDAFAGAPTAILWKGELLYHTLSGTSMAAPHSTGKLAVLIERMAQAMPLPPGYLFYLERLIRSTAHKIDGHGEHEVGAGLIDEPAALKALDEALADPDKVAAESAELLDRAQAQYGQPAAKAPVQGHWFSRMIAVIGMAGSWALAALFFLL
ncbi:MAG: S8 family serine peptidase [Elusimicrobiota bacterium]